MSCVVIGLVWLGFSSYRAIAEQRIDKDIHRRWRTAQYVQRGINPYCLALDLLETQYPDYRELKRRGCAPAIFTQPQDVPHGLLDPAIGPPDPTYPPPSLLWMAVTIGLLPSAWVNPVWTVLNLVLLALLARVLMRDLATGADADLKRLWIVAILLLWPPVQITLMTTQFGILVVLLLYLAYRFDRENRWLPAGVCWALALIKPSVSLPFMVLPLRGGRWRTIGVVLSIHVVSMTLMCWWLGTGPIALIRQWLAVTSYFVNDMYTLQELLSRLNLSHPPFGFLFMFALLGVATALALWRRRPEHDLAMFLGLCMIATFWTYHNVYDFVPVALVFIWVTFRLLPMPPRAWWACVVAFAFLAMALSEPVFLSSAPFMRLVRWGGRLGMVALVGAAFLCMAFPGKVETVPQADV